MSILSGSSLLMHNNSDTTFLISNISKADIIVTDLTEVSAVTLCSLTVFIIIIACLLAFLQFCDIGPSSMLDVRTSSVLFLLGGLIAVISCVSAVNSAMVVYRIYIFVVAVGIGLIFSVIGAYLLFDDIPYFAVQDGEMEKRHEVGHHHDNMGIIMWLVTLPVVGIEFFLVVAKLKAAHMEFYTAYTAVSLLQKIFQASLYYFYVRHRYPLIKCPSVSRCYFEIMSFINFIYWIDSIVLTREDDTYIASVYGKSFWILKAAYNALVIDYRLMCCMLFIEHAIHIKMQQPIPPNARIISASDLEQLDTAKLNERIIDIAGTARMSYRFSRNIPRYTGLGYLTGLFLLGLQTFNGLQYLDFVGCWSNLMVIINDLFILVAGTYFMFINKLQITGKWRESDSIGIDATVGIMGGIGFTFWILKALLTANLTFVHRQSSYFDEMVMTNAKYCSRAVNALFLLYLFVRVSSNVCARRPNRSKIVNHFLVSALTLSILAVFVSSVVDESHGELEKLLEHAKLDSAVKFFLTAGAPIHLGFCLHICLHFFLIRHSMTTAKARINYGSEYMDAPEDDRSDIIENIETSQTFWSRTPTPLREPLLARSISLEPNV